MGRLFFGYLGSVVLFAGLPAVQVAAQDLAAISTHYTVLPRFSTMQQTGGFAGLNQTLRVMGKYDFARGSNTGGPKFVNPELWGSLLGDGPSIAMVWDVDEIFNLKGLQGKPLPILAPSPTVGPFDAFKFQGVSSDGSAIDLIATRQGPWMYLRGWTQPPPGSADYFVNQLRVLARTGPFADFNSDDVVDGADFALFRKGGNLAGLADWRAQFGERVPDLAAIDAAVNASLSGLSAGPSIPEPTGLTLVAIAVATTTSHRKRRPTFA